MDDIEVLEEYLKSLEFMGDTMIKSSEIVKLIEYKEIKAIERLINRIKDLEEINEAHKKENGELREENTKLKANHIFTHNEISDKEKATLYNVIDSSIDKFIESAKPQWEQIMCKDKMTIEEAEEIIDNMYQHRNKILQKTGETETEVIFDVAKLDEVKFTNLEFASVRALREIQSLRRELERSIPKSLIKEKKEEYDEILYYGETEEGMAELKDYEYDEAKYGKKVLEELLNKNVK